ncbi:MAG: hypothetical protein AAGF67_18010 [Verrucomicrobiota bacterium]
MIEAAKKFVCIRIATYEDQNEAQFVTERLMREGDSLRNFGYALASPGFEDILERSDRGPNFVYGSGEEMAAKLDSISENFTPRESTDSFPGVPKMKDVRLALNVASCDGIPCLVIYGESEAELERLQQKMGVVAWDEEVAGRFIYAVASEEEALEGISGNRSGTGYLIVQPDPYGLEGKVVATVSEPNSADQLKSDLLAAVDDYSRIAKTHGQHVRSGRQNGISWETEVAVPERDRMRR